MADVTGEDIAIRVGEPRGFLNLRGDPANRLFLEGVAECFGVALPLTPGTSQRADERVAIWLGPDEWLLAMPDGEQTKMETGLRERLPGRCSLVDVSGGYVRFILAGRRARTVLQQASPHDFHPSVFAPGRCAQTVFAKATALVIATAEDSFELLVRTSYADYIRRWLATAAGVPCAYDQSHQVGT